MRVGFHLSIAKGLGQTLKDAYKLKCEVIQIFNQNPRGWKRTVKSLREITEFKEGLLRFGIFPLFIHMPYLVNLASEDPIKREKSRLLSLHVIKESVKYGAKGVVLHMGHYDNSPKAAINFLLKEIELLLKEMPPSLMLLLENSAGQGREIGFDSREWKEVFDALGKDNLQLGFCLDTAHAFQAGYDLRCTEGLERLLNDIEMAMGLDKVVLVHINDSKTPLGSRVDRHWHIGEGEIGQDGFRIIINHPHLKRLPGIMETPKKRENDDIRNMQKIKSLMSEVESDQGD